MVFFLVLCVTIFFINLHHTLVAKKAKALLANIRYGSSMVEFDTHTRSIPTCPGIRANTDFAFVSMLSSHFREYGLSATKLGHTLRRHSNLDLLMFELSTKPIPAKTKDLLKRSGWSVCTVQPINGPMTVPKNTNRFLQASVYSKFHAWNLIEYRAIALIDLDMLAVQNPSDLFTSHLPKMLSENKTLGAVREHPLTNCYGKGATNIFNAGMLLIVPSQKQFVRMVNSIDLFPHDSAADAEQALINELFKHTMFELPVSYNALTLIKTCEPELWYGHHHHFKMIHYTVTKPWTYAIKWENIQDPFMCWFWKVEEYCMLWDLIDEYNGI
jgi:alpha-N-acetylglucosamine transferase